MKSKLSIGLTLIMVLGLTVSIVGSGAEEFSADLLVEELRRAEQLINEGKTQQGLESLQGVQSILNSKISELSPDGQAGVSALKIGYVNATEAFTVFTEAVSKERESAQQKDEELRQLREKAIQGEISESQYRKQADILQAEKLKAQLEIDMAMVKTMRSAPGFESVSDQLNNLSNQVQPIMEELNSTLKNMREGSAVPEEVNNTLSQINSQYQQLDDLLTKLIESKIFQIANVRANEAGYDLVLRQENVVLYGNQDTVDNLTEMTMKALRNELNG